MKKLFSGALLFFALVYGADAAAAVLYGRVLSGDFAEPVIGASVQVRGTAVGTTTNWDGAFVLSNVGSNVTIEISGMTLCTSSFTITIGANATLSFGDIYVYENLGGDCKAPVFNSPQPMSTSTCRGKIIDDTGAGVPGASFATTNDTNIGVVSDVDGNFALSDCTLNTWYSVSMTGMEPRYVFVTASNRTSLNIALCSQNGWSAYSYSDMDTCRATGAPGEYLDFQGSYMPCPGGGKSDGLYAGVSQCYTTPSGGTSGTSNDASGNYEYTVSERCYLLD